MVRMSHSVFICEIRDLRGLKPFAALPWVAGEARAGCLAYFVDAQLRSILQVQCSSNQTWPTQPHCMGKRAIHFEGFIAVSHQCEPLASTARVAQ